MNYPSQTQTKEPCNSAKLINFAYYRYQQLRYEIDPEYLFSPIRGEGKTERAVVESYFKVNYTHRFNVGRITRPGKFLIFFHAIV